MSLIDEALKRARQEAAQQDAARRGMAPATPSWTPVPLPPLRERRSAIPLAVAAAVVVALLLAAGIAWWTRRAPAPVATVAAKPVVYPVAQPAAPPAQPAASPASRAETKREGGLDARSERADRSERTAGSDPGEREARTARAEAPRVSRAEVDREPPARREIARSNQQTAAAEPPAPRPPAAETRSAAPAPAATPAPEDGRSFVREAPLPGGRKLELRGIAFSGTQPVVLINGKVLSPGEGVEGYTVVAIEPQRVQLKGATGTLYLTLQ